MVDTQALQEPRPVRIGRAMHLNVLLLGSRNLDATEEICQSEGITHAQYIALWTLCLTDDADAGLPVGEVADGLLNRASDATRLIDRLERAGFVERLRNPNDRRSVLVRATAEGQRVFAAVTPKLQEYHRHQWSNLSRDEIDTLDHLLFKVLWGDANMNASRRAFRPYPKEGARRTLEAVGAPPSPSESSASEGRRFPLEPTRPNGKELAMALSAA